MLLKKRDFIIFHQEHKKKLFNRQSTTWILVNYWLDNTVFCKGRKIIYNTEKLIVISNLLLLLESVSSWNFFINSSVHVYSYTYCIRLLTWGKYGATCLAHSFLSVLTLFSNKKVVHSIKSLFMLQEIVTKDSTFCSALKIPSHQWHFSGIFPQTYLTSQRPLTCSTCLWTIYSANWISMCCSEV